MAGPYPVPARALDARSIGRHITVNAPGLGPTTGGISDVAQYATRQRTLLFVAGRCLDVRSDTPVVMHDHPNGVTPRG